MMRCLRIRDLIRKTHEIKKSIPILDEDVNSAKIYLNQIKTEMYRLQMHINLDNIANESDEL